MFSTHRTNWHRHIKGEKLTELAEHSVAFLCITVCFVERCFRENFISSIAMGLEIKFSVFIHGMPK